MEILFIISFPHLFNIHLCGEPDTMLSVFGKRLTCVEETIDIGTLVKQLN